MSLSDDWVWSVSTQLKNQGFGGGGWEGEDTYL